MQRYNKQRNSPKNIHNIYVKKGERPTIKSLFECLAVGDYLHINHDARLYNAIKQECFRQNEIARAVGGEDDRAISHKYTTQIHCFSFMATRRGHRSYGQYRLTHRR